MTDSKLTQEALEAELYALECKITSRGIMGELAPQATVALVRAMRFLVSEAGQAPRGIVMAPAPETVTAPDPDPPPQASLRCTKCGQVRPSALGHTKYCGDNTDRDDHHDWAKIQPPETWYECNLYADDGTRLTRGIGRTEDLARADAEKLHGPHAHNRSDFNELEMVPDRDERTRWVAHCSVAGKELAEGYGRTTHQALRNANATAQIFTGNSLNLRNVHVSWKTVLL